MEDKNIEESSYNLSVFYESFNIEELLKKNKKELSENQNNHKFLHKKKKNYKEEKEERIRKHIDRYCKRNNEMLLLLQKMNLDGITYKDFNRMLYLLSKDLYDTKKICNNNALLHNKKKEIFKKILNFPKEERQYFAMKFTNGKCENIQGECINSSNISEAKKIIKEIEEKHDNKKIINENDN